MIRGDFSEHYVILTILCQLHQQCWSDMQFSSVSFLNLCEINFVTPVLNKFWAAFFSVNGLRCKIVEW